MPEEIEKALIGKKKGDQFELDAKVRKDKVNFQVVVHDVAQVSLPDVTDEFAKQFGRGSVPELKDSIKKQLVHEKEIQAQRELEEKVLGEVLKQAKLEIPESLLNEEINRRLAHLKNQLGVMYTKFLEEKKKTEEDLKKDLIKPAQQSVKTGLVLGEIAKREGFSKERLEKESDEDFQKRVVRKTIDFLVASATGKK
jgi:trigger factor